MDTTHWRDKIAVVTGAASGIGLALSRALVRRGVKVHMTDIDAQGVHRAAAEFGVRGHPQQLDVRDAVAVRAFIQKVAHADGRIDFLFNNAGVVIDGEAHDIPIEHYDRIIDINIRGVVNGVTAAYPIMVRQRHGHIINTASLAGLAPVPLMVPYAMSKHAIVGLTTSLRIEARNYGVRVSAICPATVDTPLLDAPLPAELPGIAWRPDLRKYLGRGSGKACSPDRLAEAALRGVERNLGLIILPARARRIARLYRFAPALFIRVTQRLLSGELQGRSRSGGNPHPSASTDRTAATTAS